MIEEKSLTSAILDILVYLLAAVVFLVTFLPFLNIVSTSISGNQEVVSGQVTLLPKNITLEAFGRVFGNWMVPRSIINSLLYTVLGTVYGVIITVMMGYPMANRAFILRRPIWVMLFITMYISGGIIPTFLLVSAMGMFNNIGAMIFPLAISIGDLILLRTFLRDLPKELEESAYLDGANSVQVFFKIVLPLMKPAIATITMYYAVSKWNDFWNPMIYFKDYDKMPLTMILRDIVIAGDVSQFAARGGDAAQKAMETAYASAYNTRLQYATLLVSLVPILAMYPTLQRYFIKGISAGAVKG